MLIVSSAPVGWSGSCLFKQLGSCGNYPDTGGYGDEDEQGNPAYETNRYVFVMRR